MLLGVPADERLFCEWSNVLLTQVGALDARSVAALVPMPEAFDTCLRMLFEQKRRRLESRAATW